MRTDNLTFAAQNLSAAKSPRYTVEVAFDPASTDLHYFTSHVDAATPAAAAKTLGVVEKISGTSQTLDPANARSSIGAITFSLVDKSSAVRDLQYTKLVLGKSLRGMRVRVYIGFEGLAWADYVLVQTQLIDYVSFDDGVYKFQCSDIQREERKDIFDLATTNLALSISATDTTIQSYDTSKFTMLAHGASYSDAPSQTVGYIKLDKEIIRYTGKTATNFTGCTRGALNTKAEAHQIDPGAAQERRAKIEEYVYLEMPAVKLIYAILTGKLYGQGAATLPSAWHLGIADSYVRLADLTGIGKDLWDTADDTKGIVTRFEGLGKQDGKQFIEKELLLLLGLFSPVYADGALGLRRMSGVLSGAAYVLMLDESNVSRAGELKHDMQGLQNNLGIDWSWDDLNKRFTRFTALIDADSIAVHGKANPLRLKFRGLTGNSHTTTTLAKQFDALRDRFAGPPLRTQVECLPSLNVLEVGDVVRLRLGTIRDFVNGGTLDRSFEIQNISIDWITGKLALTLLGSSQPASEISHTTDNTVASDAWYIGTGTDLASVLTIVGGVVTANGNLAGAADMANAIYYYNGDLTVGAGVTVTINNNVQLRIKGHLTVNGTIDGKGRGLAGAAAPNPATSRAHYNAGTPGFIGATEAGGNLLLNGDTNNSGVRTTLRGASVIGLNNIAPAFALKWSGSTVLGLPTDMRGSSGASGMPFTADLFGADQYYPAGNGGAGGAGLIVICRGMSFGVAGKLDLGGGNGTPGSATVIGLIIANADSIYNAGSGAGGAPGGCLVALDGASALAPDLVNTFIAQNGLTPITGNPPVGGIERNTSFDFYSYFIGTGDGTTFPLPDLGGYNGGCRIQYVLAEPTPAQDADVGKIKPPSALALYSGTAELLTLDDGTVIPRIRAAWTASDDPRAVGYELQFKRSVDADWGNAMTDILGRSTVAAYLLGVQDSVSFDVRLRAADALRNTSDWVTVTGHTVIGKTSPPANVTGFTAAQNGNVVVLQWMQVADVDLAGYEIRYIAQGQSAWDAAIALTKVTRGTQITTAALPPGFWTLLIKARDTSGNYSTGTSVFDLDVTNTYDVIVGTDQAPDWIGAKTNCLAHWTGKLVPESTKAANQHTNAELFEQFVPYPVASFSYDIPEIDLGFVYNVRVWASFAGALGRGVTAGYINPRLQLDYHSGAGYDGFEDWAIGNIQARYLKQRMTVIVADGTGYVSSFKPSVDVLPHEEDGVLAAAAGGSPVTFTNRFYATPNIQVTPSGGSALFPAHYGQSATGFSVKVFDAAGNDVGGSVHWRALGD